MKSAQPKRHYTISEISRLFGIGIDSLRYYERLGVVTPQRGSNGYRLYDLDDIYKLSLIKDLRRLDVPMKQIKEHLDHQTLKGTLGLLEQEHHLLSERIEQLEADRASVLAHMNELQSALARPVDKVELLENRTGTASSSLHASSATPRWTSSSSACTDSTNTYSPT